MRIAPSLRLTEPERPQLTQGARSCKLRPNLSTDHAGTTSNSRRTTPKHSLSNAGRPSRVFRIF
jgi:hypothetical protein